MPTRQWTFALVCLVLVGRLSYAEPPALKKPAGRIAGALVIAGAGVDEGFGFLPGFIVDQHFLRRDRVNRLLGALDRYPGYAGLGIDEQTAVVVRGRTLTVVGNSYALVCLAASSRRPAGVRVLKAGDRGADLIAA